MTTTRFQSQGQEDAPPGAPKVHLVTFGCQMNKYDSLLAEGRFRGRGYVTTPTIMMSAAAVITAAIVGAAASAGAASAAGATRAARAAGTARAAR